VDFLIKGSIPKSIDTIDLIENNYIRVKDNIELPKRYRILCKKMKIKHNIDIVK
jgi:hypothetical protein